MAADIKLTDNSIILEGAEVQNTGPSAGCAFQDRTQPNNQRWVWYSNQGSAGLYADSRGQNVVTIGAAGQVIIDGPVAGYYFNDRVVDTIPGEGAQVQWALYSEDAKARLWAGTHGILGSPFRAHDLVTFTTGGDVTIKGDLTLGGTLRQASSIAVKDDVAELSGREALEAVENLNPVTFSYKADERRDRHVGFIAEEVPDLLANADRDSVSPMDVVALLTKVVKEQQKAISELVAAVSALKNSVPR